MGEQQLIAGNCEEGVIELVSDGVGGQFEIEAGIAAAEKDLVDFNSEDVLSLDELVGVDVEGVKKLAVVWRRGGRRVEGDDAAGQILADNFVAVEIDHRAIVTL